jgi:peptidyl-prolyl cis-trans isomerase C
MVEPFALAMARLAKGQYTTEPVQTPYGWHVIMVSDTRPLQMPPFDAIKEKLRQELEQQEIQKAVADLKSQAKIEGLSTDK